eukprot:9711554-Alexandrium_andersonii.AAC.1
MDQPVARRHHGVQHRQAAGLARQRGPLGGAQQLLHFLRHAQSGGTLPRTGSTSTLTASRLRRR